MPRYHRAPVIPWHLVTDWTAEPSEIMRLTGCAYVTACLMRRRHNPGAGRKPGSGRNRWKHLAHKQNLV